MLRRQSVALLDDNALGAATEHEEWLDHVASAEIDTTAEADGRLDDERVTDRIKLPARWLQREGLHPAEC